MRLDNGFIYLFYFCLMGLVACQEPVNTEELMYGNEPATLTFQLDNPVKISLRGYESPNTNPTEWTVMERFIDGREFYHVTVFIIGASGEMKDKLIAYRNIYKGSPDVDFHNGFWNGNTVDVNAVSGTQIKVTFNYDTPMHGEVEKLKRGNYRVLAVANYSAYDTYSGLTMNGDFAQIVNSVISDFGTDGITNFTESNYSRFFNYKLDAGSDYLCPQQPQPLSLIKDIELQPGQNSITGEMMRTYARIRVEVENLSKADDLTVNAFSFSNNFAQRHAFLFDLPESPDRKYDLSALVTTKGRPVVESTDAIIPFEANEKVIPKITDSDTANKDVVFDGYILESRDNTSNYVYSLGLRYMKFSSQSYERQSATGLITTSGVANRYNNGANPYFLIRQYTNDLYLISGESSVEAVGSPNLSGTLNENLVWELERNGNNTNQYYIKTNISGTEYYMGHPNSTSVPLVPMKSSSPYFTLSASGGYLSLYSSSRYYIQYNEGVSGSTSAGSNNTQRRRRYFQLYPVNVISSSLGKDIDIVLNTIDPITAIVDEVKSIRRNDFIKTLVTVAYNPDKGDFNFVVKPWVDKDEEITFN